MKVGQLDLVLIGNPVMAVPSHPRIHHLGFVSDEEKFNAMAAADLLIMPSYFESLSMVTLEAWALGLPTLVNGHCDVLRGQVVRANAGLYYANYQEFLESLRLLEKNRPLRQKFGMNGRAYYRRHYTWPVIEKKYLDMLQQLSVSSQQGQTIESLPGWFGRNRRTRQPAHHVVEQVPKGPVLIKRENV